MPAPTSSPGDPVRELFERTRRGERAARDALIERYLPALRGFVRLQCGELPRRRESDSDLVQSACLTLVGQLDAIEYRGEEALRAWLFGMVRNKVHEHLRFHAAAKRDARRELHSKLDDADEAAIAEVYTSFCSPSRQLMARERIERVEAAFARLPEHYREVITLAKVVGVSQRELARRMGRTVPSVRNLLNRALVRLSALLDEGTDLSPS